MTATEEMKTPKNVRKALVALLSHWRPVLCYEKLVVLDSILARKITEKSELRALEGLQFEKETIPEETVISIDSPMESTAPPPQLKTGAVAESNRPGAPNGEPLITTIPTPSGSDQGNTGKSRQRTPGSHSRGNGRLHSSGSEKTKKGMKEGHVVDEDLYKWMRDQETKQVGSKSEEINPMDIPLSLFFKPLFDSEHLEIGSGLSKFLNALGATLGFSVYIQELKVSYCY